MPSRNEMRQMIIEKALPHIPFEGWCQEILERASQEALGDPSYGWRLFPQGPLQAIAYWSTLLDQRMLEALPSPEGLRVRDKVALGVKTRLSLLKVHRETARKTATYLALPPHMGQGSKLAYTTVNHIWYYAGDTSTDYNFYTKRALLLGVYSSTFLYWLQDSSESCEATWTFLENRIENVLALPSVSKKIKETFRFWKCHG